MPYHYNPNQPRVPAGHHDGGQWTSEGGQPGERVQPVFLGPTFSLMVEASINLYAILALQNSRDRQAVVSFKARGYRPRDLYTGDLKREKVTV